ncbi:hypothetical protein [Umezawaea sp. Da 62-37]|uniref:hypothetical protein n=1 Tax=Umezawaea sp. Da 62-37 TaxID=3075927 RepID=UPI0028F72CCB|nr:hypothetical protein [Umezawaea sp. Da 62-37]WNV88505.1 hypothetical protein RM788_09465 [Umezawaea sp. Da 62-37]
MPTGTNDVTGSGRAGTTARTGAHVRARQRPDTFAVGGVILVLLLASVYVWASVLAPRGRVAAVTSVGVKGHCESGWVVPDSGDAPIPMAGRPAEAVLGSGGAVTITVRGLTGDAVVLEPPVVEVVSRRPALPGVFLPSPCGGAVPHDVLTLDLDRPTSVLGPDGEPAKFPHRVSGTESGHVVIRPVSTTDDVEWRLRIPWTSGIGSGELVVDDDGKPLRTTATSAARPFCVEEPSSARWVSCSK